MKIIKTLAIFAVFALAILSCTKNLNGDKKKAENTPIVLKANTTSPSMSKETQDSEVLSLTWNTTTNMETGARVNYSILMDNKGGNFETAYEIDLGTNATSHNFTGLELNTILEEQFGYNVGDNADIDICIYATIMSEEVDDVISNVITISLSCFQPKVTVLYMIGSATTAGWTLEDAIPMDPIEGEEGGFTWSGEMFQGELKFLVSTKDWIPCYGRGNDEGTTLYYRDHLWEDSEGNIVTDESLPHIDTPDNKFEIPEQANYKIVLNIEQLTITITKTGGPKYFSMYFIGSAVDKTVKMFRSSYAFLAGVSTKAGSAHFSVSEDNTGDFYYAASADQSLDETAVSQTSGYDWNFTKNALYHIYLFAKEGKEKAYFVEFTPYETLYLIGSATSVGWELKDALPMTKASDYVQTWTGNLKEGELKFSCDKNLDWFGAWYLASASNKAPEGVEEPVIFIDKASAAVGAMGIRELDQKWLISEAGSYSITLDQNKETVIIKKN
ncbi:MAG: SusF/SusE family outer membrane protein [Candidatus Cryptobacteroides sp.]|jgi:hypothetical protein|nr:SusF/SusE family outer membrane protein [Rikenellaceae bacterium]